MTVLLQAVTTVPSSPQLPQVFLSAIVWLPAVVGALLLAAPDRTEAHRDRIRTVAIAAAALVAGLGVVMWYGFRDQGGSFAYEETRPWFGQVGAAYHLGVDGVSMPLLLLSTVLFFIAVLASHRVRERTKAYYVLLLVLESGVNGVFASLDYLLFVLFWEMQLLPLFLLIAMGGGRARLAASWKFLAFGMGGSALLVLAIVIMAFTAPSHSLDMVTLHDAKLPAAVGTLVFWLFVIAFGSRLAVFPLHTWFNEAQAEAQGPISAILAGTITKLGGYGLYRVAVGQFPDILHRYGRLVVAGAVMTILWGAVAALAQDDVKRIVGFASMSRMGLVLLAAGTAAPTALNGGVLLLVADGLATALLLLLAGMLAERTATRSLAALGGLAARMPRTAVLWTLGVVASFGLPGLAAFPATFMVLVGAYPATRLGASLAVLGTVLSAGALLWMVERVFFGPIGERFGRLRDVGTLEMTYAVTLVTLSVLLGLLPALLVDNINFGVLTLLTRGTG